MFLTSASPPAKPGLLAPKKHLAQQFSRAAATYDQAASIQQQVATQLLQQLGQLEGHWLDLGCGSGANFAALQAAGADQITGVDLAAGMLDIATSRAQPAIQLVQADADQLPFRPAQFAGVFSSLMLQWSHQPAQSLRHWVDLLQPGGYLAIATLLPGTQQEIKQAWQQLDDRPHVMDFMPSGVLYQLLAHLPLRLSSWHTATLQQEFDQFSSLLRQLKAIGATNTLPGRATGLGGRQALRRLEEVYPRTAEGRFPLTYQVGWLIAQVRPQDTKPRQLARRTDTAATF